MVNLINNLISKLDEEEDGFLIFLLKTKIGKENENFNTTHLVSDSEVNSAKNGFNKILFNYSWRLKGDHHKMCKVSEIINRSDCDYCKYSERILPRSDSETEYGVKKNTDRCVRCNDRRNVFYDLSEMYRNNMDNAIKKVLSDEKELILLRAICNKLSKKLRYLQGKTY